jgi:hypothetical protein
MDQPSIKRTGRKKPLQVARSPRKDDPYPGYRRDQPEIEVTFTCSICGLTQTVNQLPGALPTICKPVGKEKQSKCQRKAAAERVKRWRKAHPAEAKTAAQKQNAKRQKK